MVARLRRDALRVTAGLAGAVAGTGVSGTLAPLPPAIFDYEVYLRIGYRTAEKGCKNQNYNVGMVPIT